MHKPKKTVYVSFQPNGARIYVNQLPPAEYPYVKDPDLAAMRRVPLHQWRRSQLRVLIRPPMPFQDRFIRALIWLGALALVGGALSWL